MPHLTNVCSRCISRLSFPVPCGTAGPAVSWSQNAFLRSSLFDVDIKSTNPNESTNPSAPVYQRLCILRQRLGEESPLQLSSSPAASRFAPDEECSHHHTQKHSGCFCLLSSFKSQVSSPVLPSCHAYFNYLTGLQRQGRESVLNRCPFSSPPGGYEGGGKWLEVMS